MIFVDMETKIKVMDMGIHNIFDGWKYGSRDLNDTCR